VSDS